MGCDIHCFSERKVNGKYEYIDEVLKTRSYELFGFMANVRNYSQVPPLAYEPRGLPKDISDKVKRDASNWDGVGHSFSFLTLKELNEFDYLRKFEDRRVTLQITPSFCNWAATCEEGDGVKVTFREFLGESFFEELKEITESNAERIVFWFDN